MSFRRVTGLLDASECKSPWAKPARASGVRALGLRYERQLAKVLPEARHGQWFQFRDANGIGCCQPDLILPLGKSLVILEVKLRWVPDAQDQIRLLYKPVVELASGKPVVGVVVCKILTPAVKGKVFCDLAGAIRWAAKGEEAILHWIGTGQVW